MAGAARSAGALSRPESAAQQIADLVRGADPGARLGTKNELRALCGVSVGTFNEALRLLQARGLVVVRPGPGGGLFVAEQSPMVRLGNSVLALDAEADTVADAVRIRDALDPLVLADALRHSSPADVAGYRTELATMKEAADALDPDALLQANWRLHALIAGVNPSPMLRSIYTTLLDIVRSHTVGVLPGAEEPLAEILAARYRVHAALVEAITAHDEAEVARLAVAHRVAHRPDH
jgi:DNA-binding FadR family transcriptional regulator